MKKRVEIVSQIAAVIWGIMGWMALFVIPFWVRNYDLAKTLGIYIIGWIAIAILYILSG